MYNSRLKFDINSSVFFYLVLKEVMQKQSEEDLS